MAIYNTNIIYKSQQVNQNIAYTYLLKFKIDNKVKYYYGLRYGNIREELSVKDDFIFNYRSSSNYVKEQIDENNFPYEAIVHKTFYDINEAIDYEVKFLKRIGAAHRGDFLNKVDHWKNNQINLGRTYTEEQLNNKSKASRKAQSSAEYRNKRARHAIDRWNNPKFKEYMQNKINNWKKSLPDDYYAKRTNSFLGKKHTEETLNKMRKKRGKQKNPCVKKRYICPCCMKQNLCPSSFNRHMISAHDWHKDKCQNFKRNYENISKIS